MTAPTGHPLKDDKYHMGYLLGMLEAVSWKIRGGLTPREGQALYETIQEAIKEIEAALGEGE